VGHGARQQREPILLILQYIRIYTKFLRHWEMENWVSVIIPTYNRSRTLKKAVESVLNQTHANLELIIVDDGSADDTPAIIDWYKKRNQRKIILVQQKNRGPAAARNRGLAAAGHDLIAFLDSDDWLHRDKIGLQVAAMQKEPDYLVSHTQEIWYRNGRLLNQKLRHRKESGYIFGRCLDLCAVGMSTVMVRRQLVEQVGLFDEQLPCCEDYDYWLRVSVKQPFLLIDRPLTSKDGGRTDQVSFIHRTGMDKYRIRAIEKILASGMLDANQYRMAREELVKKCRIYGMGCIKHGRLTEGEEYLSLPGSYSRLTFNNDGIAQSDSSHMKGTGKGFP
jgi:glycosyltransferase involved in cell wall biosynthesis